MYTSHIYDISKEYKAEALITERTLGRRVVAMKQSILHKHGSMQCSETLSLLGERPPIMELWSREPVLQRPLSAV